MTTTFTIRNMAATPRGFHVLNDEGEEGKKKSHMVVLGQGEKVEDVVPQNMARIEELVDLGILSMSEYTESETDEAEEGEGAEGAETGGNPNRKQVGPKRRRGKRIRKRG